MHKIRIFPASSNEHKPERGNFEIEIYRNKSWFDKGVNQTATTNISQTAEKIYNI
jgi:hypothetical protein